MSPYTQTTIYRPQLPSISFSSAIACGFSARISNNGFDVANPKSPSIISTNETPDVGAFGGVSSGIVVRPNPPVSIGPDELTNNLAGSRRFALTDDQVNRLRKIRFVILGHHMVWADLHPEDYKKILTDIIDLSPCDRETLRNSIWWPLMLDESAPFIFFVATSPGTSTWEDSDWDTLKSRLDNYLLTSKIHYRSIKRVVSANGSHTDRRIFIRECISRAAREQVPQEVSDMCQLALRALIVADPKNPNSRIRTDIKMMLAKHPESIDLQKFLYAEKNPKWEAVMLEEDICLNYISWCAAQPNALDDTYLAISWATIARQDPKYIALMKEKIDKLDENFCPNLYLFAEAIEMASDLYARRNILQDQQHLAFSIAQIEDPNWTNLEHVKVRIQAGIWTRAAGIGRLSYDDAKDFIDLIRYSSWDDLEYLGECVRLLDKSRKVIHRSIFRRALNMRKSKNSNSNRDWKHFRNYADAPRGRSKRTFPKLALKFGQQRQKFLLDSVDEAMHERLNETLVELCLHLIRSLSKENVDRKVYDDIREASTRSNLHKGISDAMQYMMHPQAREYACTHPGYQGILQRTVGFSPTFRSAMETVMDFIIWCGSQNMEVPESYLDMCWVTLPHLSLERHERIYQQLKNVQKSNQQSIHTNVILQAVLLSHRNLTRWECSNADPSSTSTSTGFAQMSSHSELLLGRNSSNPTGPACVSCPAASFV